MNKFIFDVDGTLTPSRQSMDIDFQRWFLEFCYDHDVYLVTGSDHSKTIEQVGKTIFNNTRRVYNCNGNDVWESGVNVRQNKWTLPEDACQWLSERLTESEFPLRTGLHFEHRPGMVNFSVVGRNADRTQRLQYVKWDERTDERHSITVLFNLIFSDLEATVGGETGIDISPRGNNKSQILEDFNDNDNIIFFGDAIKPGGNDYPLAQANTNGMNYHVTDWKQTWSILNAYSTNRP